MYQKNKNRQSPRHLFLIYIKQEGQQVYLPSSNQFPMRVPASVRKTPRSYGSVVMSRHGNWVSMDCRAPNPSARLQLRVVSVIAKESHVFFVQGLGRWTEG